MNAGFALLDHMLAANEADSMAGYTARSIWHECATAVFGSTKPLQQPRAFALRRFRRRPVRRRPRSVARVAGKRRPMILRLERALDTHQRHTSTFRTLAGQHGASIDEHVPTLAIFSRSSSASHKDGRNDRRFIVVKPFGRRRGTATLQTSNQRVVRSLLAGSEIEAGAIATAGTLRVRFGGHVDGVEARHPPSSGVRENVSRETAEARR